MLTIGSNLESICFYRCRYAVQMNLNIESISPTTLAIDTIPNNKKKKRKNTYLNFKKSKFSKVEPTN